MNRDFYKNLESFSDFSDITVDHHFKEVPEDWVVIITDIAGSTKAIEAGKYKDVNTVGAASIVAIQNALKPFEFPFVFGGDGATILIPQAHKEVVIRELAALKNLARDNFDLLLRVGSVDVKDVITETITIEVGKFEIHANKCVAIIRGGGLSLAEGLIKGQPEKYAVPAVESCSVNLEGLSCRWNEIPNSHGCVLSLIVLAKPDLGSEVYSDLIEEFTSIVKGNLSTVNPVQPELMTYLPFSECKQNERRFYNRSSPAWIGRIIEIILCVLVFKKKINAVFFKPNKYLESMPQHSDYRKFDDMLRLTLDCSVEQCDEISQYLENRYQKSQLNYGLHRSEAALMTCFVDSIVAGKHIHFIDGGGGGYAMAAKKLKMQLEA